MVIGLAFFAGLLALTIDVVKEAFQGPGTPLLRVEAFRTADTPFRGWTVSQVILSVVLAMGVMSFAAVTAALRSRLAAVVTLASLLVLAMLVMLTPIGRYGLAAARSVDVAGGPERFIQLESGVAYGLAGRLPYSAVPGFRAAFPDEGPQNIGIGFERRVELGLSEIAPPVPVFDVSGTTGGAYLRQLVLDRYQDGAWTQDPSEVRYSSRSDGSGFSIPQPSRKFPVRGPDISIIPITQLPPGEIITSSNAWLIEFPDPLLYSWVRKTGFAPNSHALAYKLKIASESPREVLPNVDPVAVISGVESANLATLPRIAELARALTEPYESPFDKVTALQRYLKSGFRYDPQPGPPPQGIDPVEWFIFSSNRGGALHFGSAFALMVRGAGVPARLVTGWVARDTEGRQTIQADLAHVWIEAQFVIAGETEWLEFDATPEGGAPSRAGGVKLPELQLREPVNTPLDNPAIRAFLAEALRVDLLGGTVPVTATAGGGATVLDNTPPVITPPGGITLEAEGPHGIAADTSAFRAFLAEASARDMVDGSGAVGCQERGQRKRPRSQGSRTGASIEMAGSDVLSHRATPAVPSALWSLTAVFGMGTGVASTL